MIPPRYYIACDLGAESGRVMLGCLEDGRLTLEEIHRFPNGAVSVLGSLRWDVLRIFDELKAGLRQTAARGLPVSSVSVDSWGVDYVLYNRIHPLLAPPFHYRDARTDETYPRVLKSVSAELIFAETGVQFMPINTLYHFASDVEKSPALLDAADGFLNIGDYFNFLFSGVPCVDQSNASTTQMYNPKTGNWSEKLIARCGFPAKVFPKIVPSGTVLGPLLPDVARETALAGVEVVATCSHDTGAAVAAVPATGGEDWAYLSSGTWSLVGVELSQPLISEEVRAHNFTNEAGYGGTTRFLKNISGLYILQELRKEWAEQGHSLEYSTLTMQAREAQAFRSIIRPDAPPFAKPGDMPRKIAEFCRETGQPAPETPGQFTRCIFESLALLYQQTLAEIETLTGRTIARLHIVGGGSQSALLNQFAASATGRDVLAGPVEATAIGNALIQAIALGHLQSLAELRGVVRESFPLQTYAPQDPAQWQEAFQRFSKLQP